MTPIAYIKPNRGLHLINRSLIMTKLQRLHTRYSFYFHLYQTEPEYKQ